MSEEGRGEIWCMHSLILLKIFNEAAVFNIPKEGLIAMNSTYTFTTNALRRDLEFTPSVFRTETSD